MTETAEPVMSESRFRLHIYWLILDWINLTTNLPMPAQRSVSAGRSSAAREYGHPAEWASDTSALIAHTLHGWHDALAEHRGETPPPPETSTETIRVTAAWLYLNPRIVDLLDYAGQDAVDEITSLHRRVRTTLGQGRPKHLLPTPCPRNECGLRTLTRTAGIGQDFVVCEACGHVIRDGDYPDLVRAALDTLIGTAA